MSGSSSYVVGVRINGDASGLSRAAQEALRAQRLLAGGSIREYQRTAEARAQLGVRSEREVRREIQQTEAAYNRLARSGVMSWREQRMAARAMREEVTRLTNEMGRLTTRQKIAMGAKGVAAIGAGAGVAAAVMAPKVQGALDYDTRLVHLANTAFNDRDTAGRAAGMRDLNKTIVDAVRYGGGTRDAGVGTAEQLFGSGIFKPGEVQKILREAMLAGSASNADPQQFGQMAISANQTMGIKPDQMGRIFGIGTYAGQQGGFEIKDMARWLPQQMAAAKAVGMYGEAGFAKLAALNQAAVVTAGTRDEAGNNVVNMLAKLGSQDTVKDFKKQGINLPKELAEGRMRGLDAVDVVGDLLQQQLAKDKNYQAVQKQLAAAKSTPERQAALESVASIAQGTVIGKVFQDRQALMGLYGYMQGRDRVKAIAEGSMQNTDATQRNFDLLSSQPGFKVQMAVQNKEIAQQEAMDKLTPTIGNLADKVSGLMVQYPGYTTAIMAATGALVSLAGSAAALALLNGGKLPGAGMLAGAGGAALTGAKMLGGVGLAGAVGYGAGTLLYKGALEGNAGGNLVGRGMANVASFFGSKEAEDAVRREYEFDKAGGGAGKAPRVAEPVKPLSAIAPAAPAVPGAPVPPSSPQDIVLFTQRPQPASAPIAAATAPARMAAPVSLADRLGSGTAAAPLPQEVKGEILVRVTGAPGLNVQAETKSANPSVPLRAAVGASMNGTGH